MEVVVFTNGCFDILHPGHIALLEQAKKLGTKLIVGINSDESVKTIKGNLRPIVSEKARSEVLSALRCVDEVVIFNETTPEKIIKQIKPDVLVKGGDWAIDQIVGADFVIENGGQVLSIPLIDGFSSSLIIEKINKITEIEFKDKKSEVNLVEAGLFEQSEILAKLTSSQIPAIENCGKAIIAAIKRRNKIIICTDEFSGIPQQIFDNNTQLNLNIGQFIELIDLRLVVESETSNTVESAFSKLLNINDVVIGISTAGNSSNIISAMMLARQNGCQTIALTGAEGKKLASVCDDSIIVSAKNILRIKEAHLIIGNLWSEMVNSVLSNEFE